jgi:hypothetical protein
VALSITSPAFSEATISFEKNKNNTNKKEAPYFNVYLIGNLLKIKLYSFA